MKYPLLFLGFLLLVIGGCTEAERQEARQVIQDTRQATDEAKRLAEEAQRMGEEVSPEVKQAQKDLKEMIRRPEPIDFRELKTLFPEKLGVYARVDAGGERTAILGYGLSKAHAFYEGKRGEIKMHLYDSGGLRSVKAVHAGWLYAQLDRENGTTTERTTTIKGYPGREKYRSDTQTGELDLVVADRFIVKVSGDNVPLQVLHQALDKIQLGTLASWKDKGSTSGSH
ncbi:MAG: hypothetical protein JNN12_06310 [Bacteroidetes Order II. Incertae sedis bacterium]|nr:hypothetical protein [Bacteroidetes Order II. bacterium]